MIDQRVTLGMVSERLGQRIRQLREDAGMSQVQLGIALGVGNQMISQWERGVRNPTRQNQERLAQVLGVTLAYLAYGRELEGEGNGLPALGPYLHRVYGFDAEQVAAIRRNVQAFSAERQLRELQEEYAAMQREPEDGPKPDAPPSLHPRGTMPHLYPPAADTGEDLSRPDDDE